jgi:hypothetical protein
MRYGKEDASSGREKKIDVWDGRVWDGRVWDGRVWDGRRRENIILVD